jgi:drug/metabolite transporter, DME family
MSSTSPVPIERDDPYRPGPSPMSTTPVQIRASTKVPLGASLLAIAAGAVWSFGAVVTRSAGHTDVWQYMIWRSVGIIVVIEILTKVRREPSRLPLAYTTGTKMFLATLGLLIASLGYVYALKNTTAANASFFASVTPLATVIVARFALGERLTAVTVAALALALLGLLVMVAGDLGAGNMKGNSAALLSSAGFAVYAVCIRSDPKRDWSPVMPGYAFLMIILCTTVCLVNGRTVFPPVGDIGFGLFHGGVLIVVGTLLFNGSATKVPAVAMSVFAQFELVLAPIWVFLRFAEKPKVTTLIGGMIIVSAVIGKAVLDANERDLPFTAAARRRRGPSRAS